MLEKLLTAVDSANNYGNFIAYKITLIDMLLQETNELLNPISLNPGYDAVGGGVSSASVSQIICR
ncbi:hypothetical protein IE992_01090 [Klebsiella pneumoniae]|uniref:Uncharacterized protein n=1 Tax=Klebsiella pneumoniae TaxID=573 RepID=A0A927E107_KLEPN|nr:hypothetical protein [Klebsiella pneumoniae]MBD3715734.1 hypothetical protein [Klebsiella pneumoniae]MBD3720708.1 hypothetical protein [Klebsiella pneumoniae]